MRKRLCAGLCLALLFTLLTGCEFSAYSKDEAAELEAKGREMMTAFLRNVPSSALEELSVLEERALGGPGHLTGYVKGTYRDGDGVWDFRLNAETGEVYTSRYWAELEELVGRQALEACALPPEARIEKLEISSYMLPHDSEAAGSVEHVWYARVLPFGVDPEPYLRDAGDRDVIRVTEFEVSLPDGTDLSELRLESMDFERGGVELEEATVSAGLEEVCARGNSLDYERWEQWECGEFVLRGVAERRCELRDSESGEIRIEREEFDLSEVRVEEEANDWFRLRFAAKDGETGTRIRVFVRDGSKYLEHEYTAFFSDGDYEFMGWRECGDGLWELSFNAPGKNIGFSGDTELKIRSPEMGF